MDIFKIALILIIVSTILICTTDDASAVNTGAETGYNAINVQSSQVSADSNSVDIDEENSESAKIKLTNEFREGYSPQFPDPGTVIDHSNYCDWVWSCINITNDGPDNASVTIEDIGSKGFVYYNPSIGWNGYVRSNNGTGWIWDDNFDVKTGVGTYYIPNGETYQVAILGYANKTGTITNTVNQISQDIYSPDPYPTVSANLEVSPAAVIRMNKEFRSTLNGSPIYDANYRDWVYGVVSTINSGPNAANVIYQITSSGFTPNGIYAVSTDNGLTWDWNDGSYTVGTGQWNINIPSNANYLLAIYGQITKSGTVSNTVTEISQDVYNPYSANNSRAKCLIVFDDGNVAQYNIAFSYMQTKGIIGTVYVNGYNIGQYSVLTLAELHEMAEAGWIIGNHGYNHADLTQLTDQQILNELDQQINFLLNNGLMNGAYHLSYPGGYNNVNVYAIMNDLGMLTGRTIQGNLIDNLNSLNLYQIPAYTIINTTPVSSIKQYIDNALATDSTIVLLFHNIANSNADTYDYLTSDFQDIIDYISNSGIDCLTVNDLYQQVGIAPINIPSKNTLYHTSHSTSDGYDTASAYLSVPTPIADIEISNAASDYTPQNQDNITITVTVKNNGPNTAENVTVGNWLNGNYIIWVSDDSVGAYDPVTGVWTLGDLESGSISILNIVAKVIGSNVIIANTATYNSGSTYDPNPNNNYQTINLSVLTPTTVTLNPVSGFKGDKVDLIAKLTDTQNNIPVEGKTIQFTVNGTSVGTAKTNAEGIATLAYTITQSFGTYNILAEFIQDDTYIGSNIINTLTVARIPTEIIVNPVSGFKGDKVDLIAKLTDTQNNIPVEGKTIQFTVNGTSVGTAKTNAEGIATLAYTITQSFGTYNILAEFIQDDTYIGSNIINTLTVARIPTEITVNPVSGFKGDKVDLIAKLTDTQNNIPVEGKTIQFTVNGTSVGTAKTNAEGIATLAYTITQSFGTYNILAEFIQDDTYIGSNDNNNLNVFDNTPPVIKSSNPVNNAVNVALNKVIQITFNEAIKLGSNPWIELYTTGNGIYIPFTSKINGNVLSITPTSLLAGTKYTVILHTNSITDMEGNGLASPYTTRFTTTTPPVVTSTSPVNNAVNVALNKVIKIQFNKTIQFGTNPWIEFKNSSGMGKPFKATISGSTLNITTNATMARGTTYTVIIHSNAVTDTTGTAGLATPYTTKFTTTK